MGVTAGEFDALAGISLAGDLTLAFEMLALPSDPGLSLLTYSAEPGSPSEDAMRELARWSETRTNCRQHQRDLRRDSATHCLDGAVTFWGHGAVVERQDARRRLDALAALHAVFWDSTPVAREP